MAFSVSSIVCPSPLLVYWRETWEPFVMVCPPSAVYFSYHWKNCTSNCVICVYPPWVISNFFRIHPILYTVTFLNAVLTLGHVLPFTPYRSAEITIESQLSPIYLEFSPIGNGSCLTFYTISRSFMYFPFHFFILCISMRRELRRFAWRTQKFKYNTIVSSHRLKGEGLVHPSPEV